MTDNNGYSDYVWHNIIVNTCWIMSCFIVAVLLLMKTNHHVCWPVGLIIVPIFYIGIKTKIEWEG